MMTYPMVLTCHPEGLHLRKTVAIAEMMRSLRWGSKYGKSGKRLDGYADSSDCFEIGLGASKRKCQDGVIHPGASVVFSMHAIHARQRNRCDLQLLETTDDIFDRMCRMGVQEVNASRAWRTGKRK